MKDLLLVGSQAGDSHPADARDVCHSSGREHLLRLLSFQTLDPHRRRNSHPLSDRDLICDGRQRRDC